MLCHSLWASPSRYLESLTVCFKLRLTLSSSGCWILTKMTHTPPKLVPLITQRDNYKCPAFPPPLCHKKELQRQHTSRTTFQQKCTRPMLFQSARLWCCLLQYYILRHRWIPFKPTSIILCFKVWNIKKSVLRQAPQIWLLSKTKVTWFCFMIYKLIKKDTVQPYRFLSNCKANCLYFLTITLSSIRNTQYFWNMDVSIQNIYYKL